MISNFFIQPFDLQYNKYQRYITVSIDGNRVYKDFYAVIDTSIDGLVTILVLAVCTNGKVIAFINDENEYIKLKTISQYTEIYYSPIKLLINDSKNITYLSLFFRSHKNEKIEIKSYCIKKLYRKKRAIKPKDGVVKNSQSCIFYSSKIMRASLKSSVNIMGREYKIRRTSNLPIFNNLQLLYIQDLGMINIFGKDKIYKTIAVPYGIIPGGKYVYQCDGEEITYMIEKVMEDGTVYISGETDKIVARKINNRLVIEKIFITMHPEAPQITFEPPINLMPIDIEEITMHKMTLTMGKSSVYGDVSFVGNKDKGFVASIVCDEIGWMQEKPFVTSVTFNDDNEIKIVSGMIFDNELETD